MRKIIATFVKYPFYANLVLVIIIVAGGISFFNMKKSFFPERESRDISISISYVGASPKEMDEGITTRVEQAIRGIVGIKEFNSSSSENSSRVDIETTGEYDIDETLMDVKNAVDAISSFPSGAEKPVVYKRRTTTPAMYVDLAGDVDLITLKDIAQEIEDDFLRSGIISQISIRGLPDIEISVETTEEDLLRYNLTFDQISQAISKNNLDISAGMIRSDESEMLIRTRKRSVDPNVIGEIVLRANEDGSLLRIRDIATVKMKFADVSRAMWFKQKRSVSFQVQKLREEDLGEISAFVNEYSEEFNETHDGIKMYVGFDFLEILNSRLELLYRNGSFGLLLVLITLGLFLSMRLSFWVAWGIPASFLLMFVVAVLAGTTINMISLFGMILVIGILVDDGIVIAENIYSHFESGKSPKQAAVDGTMEVLPAVVTSVLTTIVAFTPLFLVRGRMEFMTDMAFIVVVSLGISLFEAFLVLPAHVGNERVLRRRKNKTGLNYIRYHLNRAISYVRFNIYGKLLKMALHWRWAVLATPVSILMVTFGLFRGGIIKTTFFPSVPFDNFSINVAFTPGTGEKKTIEYLKRFENDMLEAEQELLEEIGETEPLIKATLTRLGNAMDGQENGAHAGTVTALLENIEHRSVSSFDLAEKVRQKVGKVNEAEKFTIAGRNRWGSPVAISLLGRNFEELEQAKVYLMKRLEEIPELININDVNAIGKREVLLDLTPEAYFMGLDNSSVSSQVRQGFYGAQSQRLQHGKDEVRIWVRYPRKDRETLGQLESMKIKTSDGQYPLTRLASYDIKRGPVTIPRYNGSREVRVEADTKDPYEPVPAILTRIKQNILPDLEAQFPGVEIVFQGQQKYSTEATDEMVKLFSAAFAIMVLILMVHFKSFLQPLIVISMIPLAVLGAAWGHGVEGIPVSVLSMWGMVALSGVVINDAVVFLSKYNSNLLDGMKVKDAIFDAGLSRFRPILLTSITTIAGLYPIVLEKSHQAQFLKPMAVSLAYGVFVGTLFILTFFPVYILVLNDFRLFLAWLKTRKIPDRESVEVAIRDAAIELE